MIAIDRRVIQLHRVPRRAISLICAFHSRCWPVRNMHPLSIVTNRIGLISHSTLWTYLKRTSYAK